MHSCFLNVDVVAVFVVTVELIPNPLYVYDEIVLPSPAVAVAVSFAVVFPCTYRFANVPLVTDDAAVNALIAGTTVDGTFAVTF